MSKMRSRLALGGAILTAGLAGCGERLVDVSPSLSPVQRDEVQRQAIRPPIERDADFETVAVDPFDEAVSRRS
ncbi:hypothetical protein AAFX91_04375 [Bradyrhizobium sp. 31Argb]|uniref:hypothetical protein n=1 Tax=unclassified Bradyrhizobium TaxID=2631580 RepID=UPI00102E8A20|nr:hypothetical protein [Bradyrhizobium sp. Leo170]TAI66487.1 hypothetical protein CWO89_07940 [Bradyrhizobium sp. Leo170]